MDTRRRDSSDLTQRDFQRILLVKPSSLGDVVHALPVLHGLRVRYPKAQISWLVGSDFRPIIDGHPEVDEVIDFDRRRYGAVGRSPGATGSFVGFLRELRRRRFDLVIDLQGLFRSGFLARATGAGVRLGFASAREMGWMFYTHRLPGRREDVHAVDHNYRVAEILGFGDVPLQFDLAVTNAERVRASELLGKTFGEPDQPFVALLPGARWETKRWAPARFAALARGLTEQTAYRPLILGGGAETVISKEIAAHCDQPPASLVGRTSLRELVAILEQAAVVVCHDSAPMHLAAALGRPLVCILGPTSAQRTGPYGACATILQADLPCVPCYLRKLSQCRHDHGCMTDIDAESVLHAVIQAAAAGEPGSNPRKVPIRSRRC